MSLMDDVTLKQYLDNPDNYIKNFEVGGKYNNTQLIDNIGSVQPIIYNGDKFKLGISVYTTKGKYDFVIIKGEIKFGENHSFISKGVNVDYAGSITFSNSGKITRISNDSGHYKPNFDDISVVKNTLVKQYGIDTSNILIDNYFN
ncbi:MAG: hypothetical protein Q8K30_06965 [Candidatus Gracilibacteria bacterium]|nr:hypothetical protein [Candidatus Gracilibacteria bacterium]